MLTARAFNRVYDLKLTVRGEMELAYMGEITTPSRCGRMDQGCAFGNRPVLMTFDGDRLDTKELRVEKDMHFVLVDLLSQKDTMEILNRLNRCYPFAENETERNVQKLLGPINKDIIHRAIDALQQSDAAAPGSADGRGPGLLRPLRHPGLPGRTDRARAAPRAQPSRPAAAHLRRQRGRIAGRRHRPVPLPQRSRPGHRRATSCEKELGLPAMKLTLQAGPKVRKAVIPAAGFGTRLFPATKATKKELFPVIDRDGIAKPAILLIVEEALDAGIEEIFIIVQRDDLNDFRNFFNAQISIENFNKLPATVPGILPPPAANGPAASISSSRKTRKALVTRSTPPTKRSAMNPSCSCSAITSTAPIRQSPAPARWWNATTSTASAWSG